MSNSPTDPADRPAAKREWSPDEDRILLAMFRQGQRRHAIAARFASSEDDVVDRLTALFREKEEKEAKKPIEPRLEMSPELEEQIKGLDAFTALFTILCQKHNQQGNLLRDLSKLLTSDQEDANALRFALGRILEPVMPDEEQRDVLIGILCDHLPKHFLLLQRRGFTLSTKPSASNG